MAPRDYPANMGVFIGASWRTSMRTMKTGITTICSTSILNNLIVVMASNDSGVSMFYNPKATNVLLKDYKKAFQPSVFLKQYYEAFSPSDISLYLKQKLLCFHDSFLTVPNGLKVLDYGAGPSIASAISAATKASDIVLAEYAEENIEFLDQWLNCEPNAFDWSPYFTYVVQELEGGGEEQVKERETKVRKLIKGLVHCDIRKDPPIQQGYDTQYDVVMCSLVLEGASSTQEEYCSNVARLVQLVKPGGSIFYYGVENKIGYYTIGDRSFPNIHITDELALKAFRDAGVDDASLKECPVGDCNVKFIFIGGKRS